MTCCSRILLLLSCLASTPLLALPVQALVPGGLALLELPEYSQTTVVRFDGHRVAVFSENKSWYALAGIPLSARPGNYEFSVAQGGEITMKSTVHVSSKDYEEQYLQIKNKRKVNPNPEDMKRISSERIRKNRARKVWNNQHPKLDFVWPVTGEISSIFGLRRFFNGEERKAHNGLDIAAPEGTPVQVAANGKVIEAGNFFFSGNIIYIDHGQGIISLYAHLSRIYVKPGTVVKKGDTIGAVGQTGRVTGPHLHFAVFANQILIDPVYLLPGI